jgi:hypothetical protein
MIMVQARAVTTDRTRILVNVVKLALAACRGRTTLGTHPHATVCAARAPVKVLGAQTGKPGGGTG